MLSREVDGFYHSMYACFSLKTFDNLRSKVLIHSDFCHFFITVNTEGMGIH